MRQIRKLAISKDGEGATPPTVSSTEVARTRHSAVDQQGIAQCSVCNCSCSCHKKRIIGGMFWRLQYSPLLEMFRPCDNPSCTARHYRIDIRLALNRYGIPFKATLGLGLVAEPGRYSLQPSLEIETVADRTAPEYDILRQLAIGKVEWTTAETELRAIYRSNPRFVHQVDSEGKGILEGSHTLLNCGHG
jgi:hypothetical protein